jgi:nicotinamide-nucleotide amidase
MTVPADHDLRRLAEALGARLLESRGMLVTAESCSGGWIAKTVTDIAGSSAWFDCGLVTYSYEAKQRLLVRPQTLETFGAVSRETALEMVSGALANSGASVAVAVTGIAGPGGGSADKPVGSVDRLEGARRLCAHRTVPVRRRPRSGAPADRVGGIARPAGPGRLTGPMRTGARCCWKRWLRCATSAACTTSPR